MSTTDSTIVIRLGHPELFDAVTGAGALENCSHYESVQFYYDPLGRTGEFGEENRCRVIMETGERTPAGSALLAKRVLTPANLRATITAMIEANHPAVANIDWSDPECDSDIDAEVADAIIQTAILGRVIFG